MSIMHLVCEPSTGNKHYFTLDMMWDEEAGTLSGTGAEVIHEWIKVGSVGLHPHPGPAHALSDDPLRSRADMAAMIGFQHRLPDVLKDSYPQYELDDTPFVVTDMDGNVIEVGQFVY